MSTATHALLSPDKPSPGRVGVEQYLGELRCVSSARRNTPVSPGSREEMSIAVHAPQVAPVPLRDVPVLGEREILDQQGHRIGKVEHREFDR